MQVQDGEPEASWQIEFGPQGEGVQGVTSATTGANGEHLVNGSPVYIGGQLQMGLCFTTSHFAPTPQVPTHGLMHF